MIEAIRPGDRVVCPTTGQPGRVLYFKRRLAVCEYLPDQPGRKPRRFKLQLPETHRDLRRAARYDRRQVDRSAPKRGRLIEICPMRDNGDWLTAIVVRTRPHLVARVITRHPVWVNAVIVQPCWRPVGQS